MLEIIIIVIYFCGICEVEAGAEIFLAQTVDPHSLSVSIVKHPLGFIVIGVNFRLLDWGQFIWAHFPDIQNTLTGIANVLNKNKVDCFVVH